jgi:hypothetical protein
MRYRRLDNGDMTFGNQQGDFLRDTPETVGQAVMTRLRLWLEEWFLDITEGTPWQQAVLGKYTRKTIEPAIRSRILNTEGVTDIEAFETIIDSENRKVTINATINTLYGQARLIEVI